MTIRFRILVFFLVFLCHNQARGDDAVVSIYTPAIDNLVLREEAGIHSKKIRLLARTESVIFLEPGLFEIIDDTPGQWIKEKKEKQEIGWCFDGYLNLGGDIVSKFDIKGVPAAKEVSRIDNPGLEKIFYVIVQRPESFDG